MNERNKISFPEKCIGLAEFLGVLVGDGFMNYYQKRQAYLIEISGNKIKDLDYHLQHLHSLIRELFNFTPKIYYAKNQNTLRTIIRNKDIFYFLNDAGFKPGRKEELNLPQWVLENQEFINSFIRGVFDTDGYLCLKNKENKKYPVIGITSKSKHLLEEIKKAIEAHKISSYLGKETEVSPRYTKVLIKYKLQISGKKNVLLFFKKINSNNPRNIVKFNEMDGSEGNRTPAVTSFSRVLSH